MSAVLVAAGFAVGSSVLSRVFPPFLPVLGPKLAYLRAHRNEYSLVFVGTSFTYRNVIPRVVDDQLRSYGFEERTFNFGAPQMTLGEANQVIQHVLALRDSRFRGIVIDVSLFSDQGTNRLTTRHIGWHTPTLTYLALTQGLGENAKARGVTRLAQATADLRACARNVTGFGHLAEAFRIAWDLTYVPGEERMEAIADDGYESIESAQTASTARRHAGFLAHQEEFVREIDARRANPSRSTSQSPYRVMMFERIVGQVREAGLDPVFYEAAVPEPPVRFESAVLGSVPEVSLNNPGAFPDLYDPQLIFDGGHLLDRGARIASGHLGLLLAEVFRAQGRRSSQLQ